VKITNYEASPCLICFILLLLHASWFQALVWSAY